MGLSPEDAENYNGQQGDIWDAHQDMLLATVGAIITGIACLLKSSHFAYHLSTQQLTIQDSFKHK